MKCGGKPAAWVLIAVLLAAATSDGCYWRRYHDLVRTHVDVLQSFARKMEDIFRTEGSFRPEHLSEFRYPYDRARDFARIVRDRQGESESFRRFESFLDRYAELLELADRVRTAADPGAPTFSGIADRLREQGSRVLDAVEAEGG